MSLIQHRTLNVAASIIVPPTLLAIFFVTGHELEARIPEEVGLWARIVALLPGFVFLVREFRLYALAMAAVYFPVMYWVTIWGSLWILIMLYGYGG